MNRLLYEIVEFFNIDTDKEETLKMSALEQNLKFVKRLHDVVLPKYNKEVTKKPTK